MAENRIAIDGSASTALTVSASASAPIPTIAGAPPGQSFYFHGMADVPGVVAANNFVSYFNPAASGKTVFFYQLAVTPYATGATTVTVSMLVSRTTAASAGTLVAANTIPRIITTSADPVLEVRTGNPTVTKTGIALIGIPPSVTAAAGGASANGVPSTPPSGAAFVLLPGQGVVLSTASGNVNQLWNTQVTWSEA